MATDPVCGMTVEPEKATAKSEHQGTTYYFCSTGCLKAFEGDPERYLKPSEIKPEGGHRHG